MTTNAGRPAHQNITTIVLRGHLDASTTAGLEPEVLASVSSSLVPVIVDISNVTYVSSEGLRLLIIMAKKARENELPIIFVSPTPMVEEVLKLTMFTKILSIAGNMDEAFAMLPR